MISLLRKEESIILYTNILKIEDQERSEVSTFLDGEYELEKVNFPFDPPSFNSEAALWAAEYVYIAAQLILFRSHEVEDVAKVLPNFKGEITASTILSVDLCFRFIPQMIDQLKNIDPDDPMILVIEEQLQDWHYSGIDYRLKTEILKTEIIHSSKCLEQLYINRIVKFKNKELAKLPAFQNILKAQFGIYEEAFWPDFKLIT